MPSVSLKQATDPGVRRKLEEADWGDLGVRLTAYAIWKARNFRWRTRHGSILAAGKTAEDVARDAIIKVLDGTRAWDPDRGPLLAYLQRVVDSLMSHLAVSADNVLVRPLVGADRLAPPPARSAAPEDDLIERLRAVLVDRRAWDLLAVLDAAQPCGPKPSAIALRLGTTVTDINNRLKRLRRVALSLLPADAAAATAKKKAQRR